MTQIQPNIGGGTQQRPRAMYKGVIKLIFVMVYFTIIWGGGGFFTLLLATGAFSIQQSYSREYVIIQQLYEAFAMTTCIVNITFYGLATREFKQELKAFLRR